jgi:hypothetical protein
MLSYLKIAGAGLFVASLIILGWQANGWRIKAAQAEVARLELRNEIERRVQADADRLALQVKLSETEAKIGVGVKVVTKTIREFIHDAPDCRITSPAVINGLRDLRAGNMPRPAPEPASARAAP